MLSTCPLKKRQKADLFSTVHIYCHWWRHHVTPNIVIQNKLDIMKLILSQSARKKKLDLNHSKGSDMLSLNWKFNYSAWKKCSREMFHCSINFLYFAFQLILYMSHEVTCAYLSQYWIFSHQMAIILKDLSICVCLHMCI